MTYEKYMEDKSEDLTGFTIKDYKTKKPIKHWGEYVYNNKHNNILTDNFVNLAVNSFWTNVILKDNITRFGLFFKVEFMDGRIRTITKLCILSNSAEDKEKLKINIMAIWGFKNKETYKESIIKKGIFTYKILPESIKTNIISPEGSKTLNNFTYGAIDLPNNADLTRWEDGSIKFNEDYTSGFIIVKKGKKTHHYIIEIRDKHYKVKIYARSKEQKPILSFYDYIDNPNDLSTFRRVIDKTEYQFIDGKLVSNSVERKVKYMKKLTRALYRTEKFITMDLETRIIDDNGKMEPVCLSTYDGEEKSTYFIKDFKDVEEMIKAGISSILKRKYYG